MSAVDCQRFTDDSVLVTGSNYGIGRAIAERFASEGARVVVTGRDRDRGLETVEDIEAGGGDATFLSADLVDPAAVESLIEDAAETYDGIDVLVNNAAAQIMRGVDEATLEEWTTAFQVNVRAYWLTAIHARTHVPDGGSIVNVSSNHAFETYRGTFPYNVTKTAINGLTRALALNFGPEIRVNTLTPGWVPTGVEEASEDQISRYEKYANVHPVGRLGKPEDIAAAAAFLASEDAAFVSGTSLLVDGGRSAVMYDEMVPDYLRDGWRGEAEVPRE